MALPSQANSPAPPTVPCAELFLVVYEDLRRLAHSRLRRLPPNHHLQATELVHDVFLRMGRKDLPSGNGPGEARARFFSATARVMRDLLVEHARRQASLKRGGGRQQSSTDTRYVEPADPSGAPGDFGEVDLLALDDALQRLASVDEHKHEVVMLRFFMQLTQKEVADVLQVCERTVERNWSFAKAWLHQQLFAEA